MTFSEEQSIVEIIIDYRPLMEGLDVEKMDLIQDVQATSPRFITVEHVDEVISYLISVGTLICVDSDPIKIHSLYTL